MVSVLAAVRPDDWNFVLFLHVLGALTLIGSVTLALVALGGAWSNGSNVMIRLGFRSLLWAALPAWIVMRFAAESIADKEGLNADGVDITWVNIGYMTAEPSLLLLLISIFLAWRGAKRSDAADGSGRGFDRAATVLMGISLVALLVAVYAMTTKPS